MRKWLSSGLIILLFFIFLIYKNEVVTGATEGLLLWYRFVLPSLLPFMILVNVMMHIDTISILAKVFGPLMKYVPGVSSKGSFAVLSGFLCGYPMGAKVSADLVAGNQISSTEGSYLLSFCNNTSPMFVMSVLLLKFVPEEELHLPFFLILFLTPLLCGQLFRIYYMHGTSGAFAVKAFPSRNPLSRREDGFPEMFDVCLMDSFHAIVKVGLYMMLFSILIRLSTALLPGRGLTKTLFLSSLEITTGLSLLAKLKIPAGFRYILLLSETSFGGFCAIFQTSSMIQESGLKILPYIAQKLITAVITSLLTYLYLCSFHPAAFS